MSAIHPYLTFDGNCEEAFNFYQSVFERPIPFWSRFSDLPSPDGKPIDEKDANKILHVSMEIGDGTILMGSDTPKDYGGVNFVSGTNVSLSINTNSKAEADKLFNGLSAGGTVTMPLQDTFWGAYFGMWTDKFGIHWMVNYDDPEKTQKH